MRQMTRRLRTLPRPRADRAGPLPSYLLFGTALGIAGRAPALMPEPARAPGRRRSSVLIFLERVLWPS